MSRSHTHEGRGEQKERENKRQNKGERQIIIKNHSQENVIVKFSRAGSSVTILFFVIIKVKKK